MGKVIIRTEALQIEEYDDAWVTPGAQRILNVYDKNGNFVPFTSKRRFGKEEYSIPETPMKFDDSKVDYYNEEVIYIGFLRGHWGHFMVDSSVRLWALERPECADKRILVTIEGMAEFYNKLFMYLKIDKSRILQLDGTVKFRKVLVPELSYFPGKYVSKEFLTPYKKVANSVYLDKPKYEKIYLSRVHFAKGKKELGEKQIEVIFEMNGYHILYPEELSYEEQVWYYKNCKIMATTNGTIAHNIVYADDGSKLIILNRYKEDNIHQNAINLIKDLDVKYIDAYYRNSNRENCLMERTSDVCEFCKEEGMLLPPESIFMKTYLLLIFKLPYLYRWFN